MEPSNRQAAATQKLGMAAFGLSLSFDVPPPGAWEPRPVHEPSLQIKMATAQAIESHWSGRDGIGWEGKIDGAPFVVERGVNGDHRFIHGAHPNQSGSPAKETHAVHHLNADASVLHCAPTNPGEMEWWRVVLDSVLFTVALLKDYEALHAGAIATQDGVIAITAASGGGKSTLLTELLGRGEALMADDVLVLESHGTEAPLAHPGPPLMTVPAARVAMPKEGFPSETICVVEDERWIAVPTSREPLPLKALVVLDRRAGHGLETSMEKIEDPLAPLLGALMNFPNTPERQRARFELASVLASTSTLWRLTADLDTPPGVLADALANTLLVRRA
jgi:hypothetical protein